MASPHAHTESRTIARRRVEWVVWLVAAGVLVAGGVRHVVRYARDMPPAIAGDRAATDRFLVSGGFTVPAAQLEAVVAGLPTDEAVYLVVPDDHPPKWGTYYAMSPLVWPRPFGLIGCTPGGGTEQVKISLPPQPPGRTVAVLLWNPPPPQADAPAAVVMPVGADAQPIDPLLELFTGQEGDIWTSFCSP
jgi:hypothetical protein